MTEPKRSHTVHTPAQSAGNGERNVCVICGLSCDFSSCPNCNGDRGLVRYVRLDVAWKERDAAVSALEAEREAHAELGARFDKQVDFEATVARLESELAEAKVKQTEAETARAISSKWYCGESAIWHNLVADARTERDAALARASELEGELAKAQSGGGGHVFEGGTPEAMRDARLRNEIFNCVEQHPTKPKIATWHYAKALQLVSDYRAELTQRSAAPSAQPTPSPSDDAATRAIRAFIEALPAATPGVSEPAFFRSIEPEVHPWPESPKPTTPTDEPPANALPVDHNSGRVRASSVSGDSRASDGGGQRLSEPAPGSGSWSEDGFLPHVVTSEPEAPRAVVVGSRWWLESDSAPALVIVDEVTDSTVAYHTRHGSPAVHTVLVADWFKRFSFSSNPSETTGKKL